LSVAKPTERIDIDGFRSAQPILRLLLILGKNLLFRALYKRRLRQAFGQFLDKEKIELVMAELSEWSCFKLVLPRIVFRYLFKTAMTDAEAVSKLRQMIAEIQKTSGGTVG
jgi:hypothetical protein